MTGLLGRVRNNVGNLVNRLRSGAQRIANQISDGPMPAPVRPMGPEQRRRFMNARTHQGRVRAAQGITARVG